MASVILDAENLWAETVTIPSGGNLADPLWTQGRAIVGIIMPSVWDAARLGFDASINNVDFTTVKDNGGNYEQAAASASEFIAIPMSDGVFAPYIRLKSVDATNVAVNQTAARTLTVLTKRYLGGS